ncbi:hypothetical protein [Pararobbsia silviterrae]|uniref:Uncharacterized protein n=1 Tax=Pararobbsia silviterrae TaxID=1792498 RepID=A0A494X206_9BURK|nr:hypothetical protein [Pararobbsia silviterrae]RKP44747.1 hypothetical protein D7S86_27385 [Pararobbsia silviterrae]
MLKLILAALVAAISLSGCNDNYPPDTPLATQSPGAQAAPVPASSPLHPVVAPRFSVARVGVFADGLAYGERRGIYVLEDSQTGKEYVGISGVGIAELGSHQVGKTQTEDER